MIRNLFGGSKCRTVDVCDIFGDNSGKALYRLDGNANDESGNYHGTETAIAYGGGAYERGAVFNGSTSKIVTSGNGITGTSFSYSVWVNPTTVASIAAGRFVTDHFTTRAILSTSGVSSTTVKYFDSVGGWKDFGYTLTTNIWTHLVLVVSGTSAKLYVNGNLQNTVTCGAIIPSGTLKIGTDSDETSGWFSGSIDQHRTFNRAITATEVATLYAECAPTSTVDDINPFLDGSLKALYQFNSNNNDKTNTYNTLFTGATTYTTGKFGQAGIVAGVTSGTANIPFPASTGSCSISYWTNNQGTRDRAFGFSQDSSHYIGVYNGGASFFNGDTTPEAMGFTIANDATMKHFVWNFSGGFASLYQNGVLMFSGRAMATGFTTINFFTDGGSTTSMLADQLRIFNKALTPMEVASLYNETTPLEEPMHSLVDPFKDGSGKALYRLDGNALDESGNYNGTATSVTYGTGRFGRAGIFNGTSSNILTTITSTTFNPISFSIYAKGSSLVSSNYAMLYSCQKYELRAKIISEGTGIIITTESGWYPLSLPIGITLNTTDWFHFVVVHNSPTAVPVAYINGAICTTGTLTSTGIVNSSFYIGSRTGTTYYFNGSIDQVRIFNRALTAGEVATLYTEI